MAAGGDTVSVGVHGEAGIASTNEGGVECGVGLAALTVIGVDSVAGRAGRVAGRAYSIRIHEEGRVADTGVAVEDRVRAAGQTGVWRVGGTGIAGHVAASAVSAGVDVRAVWTGAGGSRLVEDEAWSAGRAAVRTTADAVEAGWVAGEAGSEVAHCRVRAADTSAVDEGGTGSAGQTSGRTSIVGKTGGAGVVAGRAESVQTHSCAIWRTVALGGGRVEDGGRITSETVVELRSVAHSAGWVAKLAGAKGVHVAAGLADTAVVSLKEGVGLALEAVSGGRTVALGAGVVARHALAEIVHEEADVAAAGAVRHKRGVRLANRAAGRKTVETAGARDMAEVAISIETVHVEASVAGAGVVVHQYG